MNYVKHRRRRRRRRLQAKVTVVRSMVQTPKLVETSSGVKVNKIDGQLMAYKDRYKQLMD